MKGILCDRCKIPMVEFQIEEEVSLQTQATSGSQVPKGRCGVSGTTALSPAANPEGLSKKWIYYKCEKCNRITKITE